VATPAPTFRVRVWFTGLDPLTAAEAGLRVIPAGAAVPSCCSRVRLTLPVNPFWGVRVSWVVPLPPCGTVREVGFRERVKVGVAPPQAARRKASPIIAA
jgi:hypothetical protein